MKLSKKHKEHIDKLIDGNDKRSLIAYCDGANIDVNDASSPVYINGFKVAIRYREEMSYYYM